MEILYPVLILTGLALVFAITIDICSKKLAVKEDPRVEAVNKLLAGANCGACGKAGCGDYAKCLVEGSATLAECNATAKENKAKIAQIIGGDGELGEETIVVVACCGGNDCLNKYSYQGYGNCSSVEILAGGSKACSVGCIGNRDCSKTCAYDAIKVKDGVAHIIQSRCTQCGACIGHCPKGVVKRIPANAVYYVACSSCDKGKLVRAVCKNGCIGCGLCAKFCPSGAITMENNLPKFDYSKCTACGLCMQKCPSNTIKCINDQKYK